MKTGILAAVLILVAIAAVVLYSSAYTVEEGKQVIVTQFGAPVGDAVQDAGLHFKTPFIQEVSYLEKRLLPWDGAPESLQTKDKKRIGIDVWARWRIIDPMTFFVKVRNEQRVHDEPGPVRSMDNRLAKPAVHEGAHPADDLLAGGERRHDLDELHHRHRVEEVEPNHRLGATRNHGELHYRDG